MTSGDLTSGDLEGILTNIACIPGRWPVSPAVLIAGSPVLFGDHSMQLADTNSPRRCPRRCRPMRWPPFWDPRRRPGAAETRRLDRTRPRADAHRAAGRVRA